MKKIININLSGRAIQIEDSAYEVLRAYIESLRRYFDGEEGKDEIINDIEDRIAEIFHKKITKGATCITDTDVQEIMASIGRPEDFEKEDAGSESHERKQGDSYEKTKSYFPKGRLSRSLNDKMLGGVCGGLANYLNVDSAIVRILFALITFGGFGLGVLLYIIMWIVLPVQTTELRIGKRLYRNPDNRVIAGVCGGLGSYFNRDPWIFRIILVIPLLINLVVGLFKNAFFHFDPFPSMVFGSLTGTFFLFYVVLWIVLPEARTASEKLEMKGEKVDLESIKNSIKEELKDVKDRAKKWGSDISSDVNEFAKSVEPDVNRVGSQVIKKTGRGLGNAIGILFKAFFLFISGIIAFALVVALFALLTTGVSIYPFKNIILDGMAQNIFAWGTLILFLGVPVIGFVTWVIRRMANVKRSGYLGYIFGGLWFIGLICCLGLAFSLVGDFKARAHVNEQVDIVQPSTNRMLVKVPESNIKYYGTWMDSDGFYMTENNTFVLNNVKLKIVKSDNELYNVSLNKYAHGKGAMEAEERASVIPYNVTQQDSILFLDKGIILNANNKFRDQRVEVVIEVPVGGRIKVDGKAKKRIKRVRVNIHRDSDWEFEVETKRPEGWDYGVEYIMTADGLEPVNRREQNRTDNEESDYRYEQRNGIERERKAIEEEKKVRNTETSVQLKKNSGFEMKLSESTDKSKGSIVDSLSRSVFNPEWIETFSIPAISLFSFFE